MKRYILTFVLLMAVLVGINNGVQGLVDFGVIMFWFQSVCLLLLCGAVTKSIRTGELSGDALKHYQLMVRDWYFAGGIVIAGVVSLILAAVGFPFLGAVRLIATTLFLISIRDAFKKQGMEFA